MTFHEGQTIVHPFHGPVVVTGIADRTIRGVPVRYLDLRAIDHPLVIGVPSARAEEIGLRPIASADRIDALISILRAPTADVIPGWSRRIKDLQARLDTGDVEQLCFVIREITRRGVKSYASADGQMLRVAQRTLSTEFSLALGISREEALRLIDAAATLRPVSVFA